MPHTPGPWHTDPRFPSHILAGPITTDSAGYPTAKSICKIQGNRLTDAPHNQALIAAAPSLLTALNELQANPNDPRAHRTALDAIKLATA